MSCYAVPTVPIPAEERFQNLALFERAQSGVSSPCGMWTPSIKCPRMLHDQGLDDLICEINCRLNYCTRRFVALGHADLMKSNIPKADVKLALVGKYVELSDSYKSLIEALRHAGMKNQRLRSKISCH